MISETSWEKKKLKDLCIKIGSGATPSGGKENYKTSGISLIRSQNIYNHTFLYNGLAYIDDEQAKKLNNVDVQQDDVLLNITGDSVCRCCIVPNEILPARVNQHVAIIRVDKSKLDPFFLKSFLTNELMQNFMLSLAQTGGTRAALTKGMIEEFELLVPDLGEQNRISKTLCSLDKKIELNNAINKNLEEMAQALFKRWFVDFEFPNENGEPYKSSGGAFEKSELGLIPKGWKVGNFQEIILETSGGDWGKDSPVGNFIKEVSCVRGADIPEIAKGSTGKVPQRFILLKNAEKKSLVAGDIIVEVSGGSPTQSTGRTAFITNEVIDKFDHPLICTNFCRVIKSQPRFQEFLYSYLNCMYKDDLLFQYENGTTGIKNLDLNSLFNVHRIIIPEINIINQYASLFSKIHTNIQHIGEESATLSQIRDTLLPKLMSGEIRVPVEQEYTQSVDLPMVAEDSEKYSAH
ncbi:restriction endonuclease subunit S [Paenibacillus sp. MMS20-IR301]|uniref:restriction endonuclease subunit S n=1 Tax=Paenibacillus sp. MMS20-IR301 TaxID=2895946 RepID=UPI0028E4AD84|nr:restriction endonuclease subunit S [Paenibacillus sp. MMS20-IR301]WNS42050.1 restriction endonuclease subunit S [Paenibacillus sp. MMS20-IR301]